jgi:hypothetical protein
MIIHTYHAVPLPRPCRDPVATLPRPCHSRKQAGLPHAVSRRQMLIHKYYTVTTPLCAVALRGRFQNGIFVAWQGNGMACVNQARPHCVNQMRKTQYKPLAERHGRETAWERHGMCELAFTLASARPAYVC